jgi:hypothetical protein
MFQRDDKKTPASNGRFGAMAALARGQYCGKFNVIAPQQVQWKPPLRQAAWTLAVMRDSAVRTSSEKR